MSAFDAWDSLRPILLLSPEQRREFDSTGRCHGGSTHCPMCMRPVAFWGGGQGPVVRLEDGSRQQSTERWRRFAPCGCEAREVLR